MSKPVKRFLIGLGKILGVCFAFCLGFYLIAELTWFHGSLIGELLHINTNHNLEHDDEEKIIEFVPVPESVANRGIILRGPSDLSKGFGDFRLSTNGGTIWAYSYRCNCNLNVYSSDSEFLEFCESFAEYDDPYYPDTKRGSNFTAVYTVGNSTCQIFRTDMYNGNLSDGRIIMEGDPGYPAPVCYDPTGKYILLLNTDFNECLEDFILEFLEPEMVKVEVTTLTEEGYESTDADEIKKEVDYIHSLELLEVEEEMPELAMAENQTTYSFTDVNGYTNDYTIIGIYLIHGDKIYQIQNA